MGRLRKPGKISEGAIGRQRTDNNYRRLQRERCRLDEPGRNRSWFGRKKAWIVARQVRRRRSRRIRETQHGEGRDGLFVAYCPPQWESSGVYDLDRNSRIGQARV